MKSLFDGNLTALAEIFPTPLYVVGGFVRNAILCGRPSDDIDLCAPLMSERAAELIERAGFTVLTHYQRTGTVLFCRNKQKYEYTSFRTDEYSGGGHLPEKTTFTDNILLDARRRDFKCNAVYVNVKTGEIFDPLGGVYDIKNKILDTVVSPETVFSHDGLRLMRLARFAGELGFTPTKHVVMAAKRFADNINDVAAERIYDELKKILVADAKYPFSPKDGHYVALKILDETRVLDRILPELALGRGMQQRKDFHDYDVLEHSLKTVLFADKKIRLAALLHDVGKPLCKISTSRFHGHDKESAKIIGQIADRLRFDLSARRQAVFLAGAHMYDLDGKTGEKKLRLFILDNQKYFNDLLLLKQADFSACKCDLSVCPTVEKWKKIYSEMKAEKLPFSVKELNVSAMDLQAAGVKKEKLGLTLKKLLDAVVLGNLPNDKLLLTKYALNFKD